MTDYTDDRPSVGTTAFVLLQDLSVSTEVPEDAHFDSLAALAKFIVDEDAYVEDADPFSEVRIAAIGAAQYTINRGEVAAVQNIAPLEFRAALLRAYDAKSMPL